MKICTITATHFLSLSNSLSPSKSSIPQLFSHNVSSYQDSIFFSTHAILECNLYTPRYNTLPFSQLMVYCTHIPRSSLTSLNIASPSSHLSLPSRSRELCIYMYAAAYATSPHLPPLASPPCDGDVRWLSSEGVVRRKEAGIPITLTHSSPSDQTIAMHKWLITQPLSFFKSDDFKFESRPPPYLCRCAPASLINKQPTLT